MTEADNVDRFYYLWIVLKKTRKHKKAVARLEQGMSGLPMEERILASAQRILDRESNDDVGDKALFRHQAPSFSNFLEYLTDMATSPPDEPISSYCRSILPPRTGKTVVAAKIIASTELRSTFIVPTRALVHQTRREFRTHLPGVPTGVYFGEEKRPVENGVNIITHQTLQMHFRKGTLPEVIRSSALVFLDEAHHSMTPARVKTIRDVFDDNSIRVALTATPNYNAQKRLRRFFPKLIHELDLADALEAGLLAPSRMWVLEVDADASTVRFVAGDYELETLGRLMSSSPFFKAVEVFRYSASNRDIPAMVACSSRQQAYDLWVYLKNHAPEGRPAPGLILGDTPNDKRARLLGDFESGRLDTIIQVGVLIEGWNAPRCKLMLDLAPSLSRVRATQKYFRVMTRYKDRDPSDQKRITREPLMETLNAFCGGPKEIPDPEELMMIKESFDLLLEIIKELDKRQFFVCAQRFGLFGASESTFSEIGMKLNVSRERARQILCKAVRIINFKYRKRGKDRRLLRKPAADSPYTSGILGRLKK